MATIRDRYVIEVDTSGAQRGVSGVGGAIGGLAGRLRSLGPLIGAAAAGLAAFGTISAIQNRIDDFDELGKRARAVGAATEESFRGFQVLTGFLNEAGISAGETDAILRKLSTGVAEAESGTEKFAAIFDKLGDAAKDTNGNFLEAPALFEAVAGAVQDGTLSMTEATDLFGRNAGPNLVNILKDMAANGVEVADALEDVGNNTNIVDLEAAGNAEAFNDNIGRLKEGLSQLMTDAVTPLLPILLDLSERVLAGMPAFIEGVSSAFNALQPILTLIGTVLTELVFPILGKVFEVLGSIGTAISPLVEMAIPALTRAFEFVVTVVERVVETIAGLIDRLAQFGERARQLKDGVTGAFSDMGSAVSTRVENMGNNVKDSFNSMYDFVVGNSVVPDMVRDVLAEFDSMNTGMVVGTNDSTRLVNSNFATLIGSANQVGTALRNAGSGIMESIGNIFNLNTGQSNTVRGLNEIASAIQTVTGQAGGLNSVLGSLGSTGSTLKSTSTGIKGLDSLLNTIGSVVGAVGSVKSLFAGFFADGGFIPRGQFGVVGERGPELVSGPAQITPIDNMGGSVTYNINAVDALSFQQLLARDPSLIHALAQKGSQRFPGSRR